MDDIELTPAFLETIGIEDFTLRREFGRERGLNPTPTEAHKREIETLNQKISSKNVVGKNTKKEEEEESIQFDLKSAPRVILFQGKVLKKSYSAIVQHNSRRHVVLLNDVLLICSVQSSGSLVNFMTEKLSLHQVFQLDQLSILDCKLVNPDEDPCLFEIRTSERPYQLVAESESDKKIWLEELESAIFCIMASKSFKKPGWQHETVLGTIHSAAMLGDIELLRRHIDRAGGNIDVVDESGMTPLHWASLFGHIEAVKLLIEAGSDIDMLNSGLNSALLLAASCGHDTVAFYLIDNGADIFIRNLKDLDCMFMVVLYGHQSGGLKNIINALQYKGVDFNKQDASGATPLHECAAKNLSRPVQTLVDAGAEVNTKHGRNGLTPLQMACSVLDPDPETVRSFLEKGAHPNWKDTAKRSAFDMVLTAHQSKVKNHGVSAKSAGGNNNNNNNSLMQETFDETTEFAQVALPVLTEIARKGGRFTEESIAHLRNSFKAAIKSASEEWTRQCEPDTFQQYMAYKASQNQYIKPIWTSDSASQRCLLCIDKFTYSNRRHHCRICGILCCDLCSQKRLNILLIRKKDRASTSPQPQPENSNNTNSNNNGTMNSSSNKVDPTKESVYVMDVLIA